MNARNPSDSPHGESAETTPPVLHPDQVARDGMLDIVWSSPVSTGTGLAGGMRQQVSSEQDAVADPVWSTRHVFAFESDLLDNAFVHWEHEKPTLEMIPGFKQDSVTEGDIAYPAESIASGLATELQNGLEMHITRVEPGQGTDAVAGPAQPFQPDLSQGASGPMKVRDDGVEDPVTGWRPTGMVFFETLSTPPRGTVYSSSMLDAFNDALNGEQGNAYLGASANMTGNSPASPFFDFPDTVAPAPPEETDEFPLDEIVIKGGRGGGGGIHFFRLFGRLVLLGFVLLLVLLIGAGGSYAWYVKQRLYNGEVSGRDITITVSPGESFRSIIDGMQKDGLLKGFVGLDDRYLMRYLAYAYENSDKIKPGVYRFNSGQNLNDVYSKLISGSKDFKITIPEGKTAREVAELVAKQYKHFDAAHFMELVNDPQFIHSLGVEAPSLEGYLYPSTYYFGPGMKEEELVKLMVATFEQKLDSIKDEMTTTGLTLQEHVIMASLIEREARLDEDRPLIASVIYNRLHKGVPLQIDATVNFALGNWRRLNNSDYKIDHPYNTYKIKGLPPGPITSPRIESLLATYQAPDTDYLYYVHKGDGHHAFAETYAQHQANVGRYIREKNAPGMGNAPTEEMPDSGSEFAAHDDSTVIGRSEAKTPSVAGDADKSVPDPEDAPASKTESDNAAAESNVDESTPEEKPVIDIKIEKKEQPKSEVPTAAPKSY